jgi:hypothetical protein
VAVLHQAPHDVRSHAAESDHSKLHPVSLARSSRQMAARARNVRLDRVTGGTRRGGVAWR